MSFCLVGECENPDVYCILKRVEAKNLKIWISKKNLNLVFEVEKKKS
jgi:hypothetical protein